MMTLFLSSALITACHRSPAADAIQVAARDGDLGTLNALLKEHPDLIYRRNGSGETALIYASCFDHKNVAERLLAKGADVNAKTNDGLTSLHWASEHGTWVCAIAALEGRRRTCQEQRWRDAAG